MNKFIIIALVFEASILSSPALARATNPSEHPAQAEQEQNGTWAPSPTDFEGRRWRGFLPN